MTGLSRPSAQVLHRAVVSLPAWHVLESLCAIAPRRAPLAMVLASTGLDLGQAQQATDSLRRNGLLVVNRSGEVGLARAHARAVSRLFEEVDANRLLMLAIIKQAAHLECTGGRVSL